MDKTSATRRNWFKACKNFDQFAKSDHKDKIDDLVMEGRLATAKEAQTFFVATEQQATRAAVALYALCTRGCSRA